jgi:hypothetical protein
LSDLLTSSVDDVVSFQEEVVIGGLPSFITDVLDQLAGDRAAPEVLEELILNADPTSFAGSLVAKLTDPAYAAALGEAAGALRRLFPPVPVNPSPACTAGQCDDADACTDDSCDAASGCVHTARPGLDGVVCTLNTGFAACPQVPKGVTKLIQKARGQVGKAISKPKKSKALLRKANKALAKAVGVAAKAFRKRKISEGCSQALAVHLGEVRTRIALLLTS